MSYYIPVWLFGQVLLISSYFTTSPGGWPAGRADAGYIKMKAYLSLQEKLDFKLRLSLAIIYIDVEWSINRFLCEPDCSGPPERVLTTALFGSYNYIHRIVVSSKFEYS